MIMKHYDECGRPKTTKMNKFAFPPEIISKLGPIANEPANMEELTKSFETVFEYSVKTMHPFFIDKLYSGSDPIG